MLTAIICITIIIIAVLAMVLYNSIAKKRMMNIANNGEICVATIHDRHSYLPDPDNNTLQLLIDIEYPLHGKIERHQYTSHWIDILEMQDFAFAHPAGSQTEIRYLAGTPHQIIIQSEKRPINFYLLDNV